MAGSSIDASSILHGFYLHGKKTRNFFLSFFLSFQPGSAVAIVSDRFIQQQQQQQHFLLRY
jgi:hypothetical protein